MNKNLTPEQKHILREEGTESPGSSSLNYEKRKIKRDQFKKEVEDRRAKRLEELGFSNKDSFDEFASKALMNEVLNTVVNLIESKEIESS